MFVVPPLTLTVVRLFVAPTVPSNSVVPALVTCIVDGTPCAFELINNRINSAASPFWINPDGETNGGRYFLWGNYYGPDGGSNHGLNVGTVIDSGMVDSVTSP